MPRAGYELVHLVTGYPSLAARKIVETILVHEPKAFVYLVILPKLAADAVAALEALAPDLRSRVEVLDGDAAAMDMGLSGAEWKRIAAEIDYLHHLAHASFLGIDAATAKSLNVHGALEIVELARACSSLRCLAYHSTALVAGNRTGVVYEDELDVGQSFRNVVEETRMQGEKIVRAAMSEIPAVVVRPSIVIGDSGTGEAPRFDGPYLLVMLLMSAPAEVAIPLPGKGDAPLHVVPVDFVARAAYAISKNPGAPGKTAHLVDPRPLPARAAFELIAHVAGKRAPSGSIPTPVARAVMRAPGIERLLRTPRTLVDQLTSSVHYDARTAAQLLAGTGIECPPLPSYVDSIVLAVQKHLHAQARKRDPDLDMFEDLVGEDPVP